MAEKWVRTKAGAHLSGRKRYGTEPEMLLRRALHALGCRYRVQNRIAPGCRPDILFPGPRVAVFVDGDFWHGCPTHGRLQFTGPNAKLWVEKLAKNQQRDARATALAEAEGYEVVRVWECVVRADPRRVALDIHAIVQDRVDAKVRRFKADIDR